MKTAATQTTRLKTMIQTISLEALRGRRGWRQHSWLDSAQSHRVVLSAADGNMYGLRCMFSDFVLRQYDWVPF